MTREWQSDDEVALTADIIDLARQYDATDIVEYLAQIQEKQFAAMLSCDVAYWHETDMP
jgi:hypothetical protein